MCGYFCTKKKKHLVGFSGLFLTNNFQQNDNTIIFLIDFFYIKTGVI